jgi:TonB-linked SusC/RagA family outer membrane protein
MKTVFYKSSFFLKNRAVKSICLLAVMLLIGFYQPSYGQNNTSRAVSGVVVDDKSEPIIGASVLEKGNPSNGTITDVNGKFTISCKQNSEIVVSFIGYVSQVVSTRGRSQLRIVLKPSSLELDEVVVVGYGTRKKATLSGAVGTFDGKELQSKPFPNVSQALQGQIPGLVVNRTGGAPGRGASFQVRGISSLNGGSPLILIDGAEGDLNTLNPNDIDNISVLKDASAAIYGARASDGVILITTRAGKKGAPTISFNTYYAIKKPAARRETVSLYEYAMMGRDAASDGSAQAGGFGYEYASDSDLEKILANDPTPEKNGIWGTYPKFFQNQDWYNQTIKNGNMQNYNIDVSGGSDRVTYLISGAYQNEDGIVKFGSDNYKRYNIRSKIDVNILRNLVLRTNVSYDATIRKGSVSDYFFGCLNQMRCWAPIYNPAGHFYRFQNYPQVAQMLEEGGRNNSRMTKWNGNFKLEYEIIQGLKLIGQAAIVTTQNFAKSYSRAYDQYDWDDNIYAKDLTQNGASNGYSRNNYENFSVIMDFNRTFGRHNVMAMFGASQEQNTYDGFSAYRQNFTNNELFELDLGDSNKQFANGNGNDWAIRSYFGRIGYIFDNRYIIDASFRYDGSSRFHPDHRWGFFPGISAAWYISEEQFMKDLNIFDNLKLRASYGKVGNQSGIGLYDYFETITTPTWSGYYPFGIGGSMSVGARSGGMVSLTRTWESINNFNIGLDLGVLNNRLSITADVFYKKNKNMLVAVSYPSVLGASAPYTNNGSLQVKGFELTLGWRDKIGKDFEYGVRLSLSDAKNKILSLNGVSTYGEGLNGAVEGYSTNSYFGYKADGYIQTQEERDEYIKMNGVFSSLRMGDMKYRDLDGDGKFTSYGDGKDYKGDLTYLGNSNPRYNFGVNIDMNWKGFDFSAFVQGVGKRSMMLTGINGVPYYYPWYDPARYFYGNTWSESNTNAKYPRLSFNNNIIQWDYKVSSHRIINAAYARLKNLQIGYTIPQYLTSKVNIKKVRVYFSGTDLFEIHHLPKGYDPEDPKEADQYPFTRFYSFGFNLTF